MAIAKALLVVSLTVILAGHISEALECCSEYTDLYGEHHKPQLCQDYCCLELSISTLTKSCCSSELLRVPPEQRTEDCIVSWISQHIWVPIVGGVSFLVLIIIIVVGCCCCCRNNDTAWMPITLLSCLLQMILV